MCGCPPLPGSTRMTFASCASGAGAGSAMIAAGAAGGAGGVGGTAGGTCAQPETVIEPAAKQPISVFFHNCMTCSSCDWAPLGTPAGYRSAYLVVSLASVRVVADVN